MSRASTITDMIGKPLVNISEIAVIIRSNRSTAKKMMDGCPYIERGRAKYYLSSDVAKRIAGEFKL